MFRFVLFLFPHIFAVFFCFFFGGGVVGILAYIVKIQDSSFERWYITKRKGIVYLDDDLNLCAKLQVIWISCQKFHSLGLRAFQRHVALPPKAEHEMH